MKNYFIRLGRYLLLLVLLMVVVIVPTVINRKVDFADAVNTIFSNDRTRLVLLVAVIYSFFYPLLVFGKKERYINGKFESNREGFLKAFDEQGYKLRKESGNMLGFRKKSGFTRVMSMGQDKIEADISGNPVIIDGLKKELRRLDVSLDMNLLRKE
ncbi:MAG: hypothetical protein JXB00_13555 [Bacteroidales bacterium]|nr:hypothetical protein [Bacteroidales bacterium]